MGDIAAVVLTVGEPLLARAYASLEAQTLPPAEVIEVRSVAPFHRAFNQGVAQVTTEFLVQLDADMVLDPDCLEIMRGIMTDQLGLVRAMRRDPLLGRDSSFKLYRTEACRQAPMPDSVAGDIDMRSGMLERGWGVATALRFGGPAPDLWHTLLDHRPDYSPRYTFEKHLAEGRRYSHLDHPRGLRWKLGQLRRVGHPMNLMARLGICRGLFTGSDRESGMAQAREGEFARLAPFLQRESRPGRRLRAPRLWARQPGELFRVSREMGQALAEHGTWDDFARLTESLCRRRSQRSWIAQVGLAEGLCDGLAAGTDAARSLADDEHVMAHWWST